MKNVPSELEQIDYLWQCLNDAMLYGYKIQTALKNHPENALETVLTPEAEYYFESRSILEYHLTDCWLRSLEG